MVKIIRTNTKLKVESDFSKEFVTLAKTIKGRWEKPYWVFPVEQEKRLREILMEVYGEDGTSEENASKEVRSEKADLGKVSIYALLKEKDTLMARISELDKAIRKEVENHAE